MELIDGAPLGEHFNSLKEKGERFLEERLWNIFTQVMLVNIVSLTNCRKFLYSLTIQQHSRIGFHFLSKTLPSYLSASF